MDFLKWLMYRIWMEKEDTIVNEGNQGEKDTCSHSLVEAKRVDHMNMRVDKRSL
jgi:hypothetical protein